MNDCPFCDERFAFLQELCSHVVRKHHHEVVNGRHLSLTCYTSSYGFIAVICWCGCQYNFKTSDFAVVSHWGQHIRRRGGMAAHVLELTLLGSNSDGKDH